MNATIHSKPRRRVVTGLVLGVALTTLYLLAAPDSDADSKAKTDLIRGPIGPTGCVQCHEKELEAWQKTHHFQSKKVLFSKEGKSVIKKMGLRGLPHKQKLCQTCHVTLYSAEGTSKEKVKWGVSCESCHSPSKHWIEVHGKLTPHKTPESEPAEHREQRLAAAEAKGMILPSDIFRLASNCFSCHTTPQEKLVNKGGHSPGSGEFELLAWSQGEVRHRFLRNNGNKEAPAARRRVLYVVGQMADLRGSLSALALAKEDGKFSQAMVVRIKNAQAALGKIAEALGDGEAATAVKEIAGAVTVDELKHGNADALNKAADVVREKGEAFSATYQGADALAKVDSLLPTKVQGEPLGR